MTGLILLSKNEYITTEPIEYRWRMGEVWLRIVIPPGQNTDLMSSPRFAEWLGFKKSDPRTHLASQIHDFLCHRVRYHNGIMPPGTYQYYSKPAGKGEQDWKDTHSVVWTYREADKLFEQVLVDSGFPKTKARAAYLSLRAFGWVYRAFNK